MTNQQPLLDRIQDLEDYADRYRWLRDCSANQYEHPLVVSQMRMEHGMRYVGPLTGKALDNAIDKARGTT